MQELPFGKYCEEEFDLSQGFVSKLVGEYDHYIIQGGLPLSRIEGIDHEKLYLAAKTEGTVEEQLARAQTLSRSELKIEKGEKDKHAADYGTFCKNCWLPPETHP